MALSTRFTQMFGLQHPIALAPMGGSAGGALTAAVSSGGGLVLLGADLVAPIPVLAAGGIADGRGLAAALALGAAGALIGTRFQATTQALVDPAITKAILEGRGQDTERSRVLDIVRGSRWPAAYTARTLGHPYLDRWRGREDELPADATADYQEDVRRGTVPSLPVWAGEAVDLITDLPSAADLVPALAAAAEEALARAGRTA
jgi:nitronate monooxygenase